MFVFETLFLIVPAQQTDKEIATLEGDIRELKDAIDAKNAPMMVSKFNAIWILLRRSEISYSSVTILVND